MLLMRQSHFSDTMMFAMGASKRADLNMTGIIIG